MDSLIHAFESSMFSMRKEPHRLMEPRLVNSVVLIMDSQLCEPYENCKSSVSSPEIPMTLGWNMICSPFFPPLQQASFRAPFREAGLFQGWERIEESGRRRLCKAGHLPLLPDWLACGLAVRIGITCLRRLLLTGSYDRRHIQYAIWSSIMRD